METASPLSNVDVSASEDVEDYADELQTESGRERLQNFINHYEGFPELWNTAHTQYMNKNKRNVALDKLIHPYKQIKPDATRADVRKKINSLRTNYRKDLKKVISSKRSGVSTDNIYQPSSWVFHSLHFLGASEAPANMGKSKNESEESQAIAEEPLVEPTTKTTLAASSSSIDIVHPPQKGKVRGPISKQNELLTLACKYLSATAPPENEDDYSLHMAKVWATKLTKLDSLQRIFAEKAINDVLLEAELGNLNKGSVKINQDQPYPCYYADSGSSTTDRTHQPTPTLSMSSTSPADTGEGHSLATLFSTYTEN